MTLGRGLARGALLGCAAALAGCGFGPGPSSSGTATLTVTRDYGSRELVHAGEADPPESETVIRLLDREVEISTRYGGGFVQSIDGLAGGERGGRRYDWFFYVNGVESPVGAGEVPVRGGDRIWWDYRDWTDAMRVPAVVGSWPEPFAQASAGRDPEPVRVECLAGGRACATATDRLGDAGVEAPIEDPRQAQPRGRGGLRVLVGPWRKLREDRAVDALAGGPAANGVFAAFEAGSGDADHLIALDSTATPVRDLGTRAGLVAALKPSDGPPTWIVTGASDAAVRRAAGALDQRDLRDNYAVAAAPGARPLPLPLEPKGGDG